MSRYGSATASWSKVEANMAFQYNLTLDDIWTMSWRRFVILFDSLWPRKDLDEQEDESVKKFDVIKDWNDLVGTQTEAKPRELHEYMKDMGIG